MPEGLVLVHEHTDHYSVQTSEPCTLPELNAKITALLQRASSQTPEEFLRPLTESDQDN